jgi:hypothetical protein
MAVFSLLLHSSQRSSFSSRSRAEKNSFLIVCPKNIHQKFFFLHHELPARRPPPVFISHSSSLRFSGANLWFVLSTDVPRCVRWNIHRARKSFLCSFARPSASLRAVENFPPASSCSTSLRLWLGGKKIIKRRPTLCVRD